MIEIPIDDEEECKTACELLFRIVNGDNKYMPLHANFIVISDNKPIKSFINEKIKGVLEKEDIKRTFQFDLPKILHNFKLFSKEKTINLK